MFNARKPFMSDKKEIQYGQANKKYALSAVPLGIL